MLAFTVPLFLLQGGGVYVDSGTVTFNTCNIYGNKADYVRAVHAFNTPPHATTRHHTPPHATTRHRTEHQCPCLQRNLNAPLGCSLSPFCVDLQGGGVYVGRGTVSFDNCNIYGNTANDVRAFHTPFTRLSHAFHTPPHATTRHHT